MIWSVIIRGLFSYSAIMESSWSARTQLPLKPFCSYDLCQISNGPKRFNEVMLSVKPSNFIEERRDRLKTYFGIGSKTSGAQWLLRCCDVTFSFVHLFYFSSYIASFLKILKRLIGSAIMKFIYFSIFLFSQIAEC